ncbi:MAG: porin, partial [Ignavibacteriaceae bacterium]
MIYKHKTVKNIFLTIVMILSLFMTANAATLDTTAAAAPPANPLSITGLVDVNYNVNFNNPLSRMNGYRNFDVYENNFNINEARLTFQKNAAPVGFRVDLAYGQTMDLVNSNSSLGTQVSLKNVEQAYLTAVIPIGSGLTINAGKMATHMGAEVIETLGNINYSRSFLFAYAIPYFHNGVSAGYTFSPVFAANLYVYNGWNTVIDNNTDKTLGAEITWTPDSIFNFTENFI